MTNFTTQAREICTELHDTGGHYLLSEEQFAALTSLHYQGIEETLEELEHNIWGDDTEPPGDVMDTRYVFDNIHAALAQVRQLKEETSK